MEGVRLSKRMLRKFGPETELSRQPFMRGQLEKICKEGFDNLR